MGRYCQPFSFRLVIHTVLYMGAIQWADTVNPSVSDKIRDLDSSDKHPIWTLYFLQRVFQCCQHTCQGDGVLG